MISANNITLRLGKKALFEDVNIKFTEGNCYGLIGANGAGKSTFLKILSGQLEPTSGDVVITPGQRLSFLQQDHFKYDEFNVLDTVIMGNKRLYDIMKEKDAIYMKEDFSDEDGIRASELEANRQTIHLLGHDWKGISGHTSNSFKATRQFIVNDTTLTNSNAFANAKATGDAIKQNYQQLSHAIGMIMVILDSLDENQVIIDIKNRLSALEEQKKENDK